MNEILAITRCTIKELARSYHYKLLFIFLSLLLQLSFLVAALYQVYFTTRSPNLAYNGMQFLVGNVDPTYFFFLQFVVVALVLVHFEQMRGRDLMESVTAKSYKNICWIIGTVLGISILVYVIARVNFIVLYGVSLQGEVFNLDFGPAPELMSVLNLVFVDIPTTIVFYVALAMVFHQIRPTKLFVGTSTLTVAFLHLVLIQSVPFSWREIMSYSTTNSVLVSEILPYFSTGWILFNRLVSIILAVGMFLVASLLDTRRDSLRPRYMQAAATCVALGIAGLFVHGFVLNHENQEKQRVAATHRTSSDQGWLDLTRIQGQVKVDPGISLFIDVELFVKKLGEHTLDSLQFSFNPGMDLEHVLVDDRQQDFFFADGLITIPLNSTDPTTHTWTVSIQASGVPDVDFGYPEPEIDFLGQSGLSLQMPKLLGVKNSIFDPRFVALMPGIRWYPVPLPMGTDKWVQSMQSPGDTYSVDLDIQIAEENWKLAAPERTILESKDFLHYKIHSDGEVPHFAIVASEFHSRIMKANDVELELLIHNRHFKESESMNAIWDLMLSFVAERLSDLSEAGLPFPYKSLTFVEVPNHLRLIGGYDMPFLYSQPGLVFLRESGYPTANWDRRYEEYLGFEMMSESDRAKDMTESIFLYDYTNALGGNLVRAVADQYSPSMDFVPGWQGLVLTHMRRFLVNDIVMGPDDYNTSPSDITVVAEIADLTAIYPGLVLDTFFRVNEQQDPRRLEGQIYEQYMLSDASFSVQSMRMSELIQSEDFSLRRSAIELRLSDMYRALMALYGGAKLNNLLELETKRIAEQKQLDTGKDDREHNDSSNSVIPILSEWYESTRAPAFSISDLKVVRVAVENTPYIQRASFKVRNDTDVTGVLKLYTDHEFDSFDTGICFEAPGQTAYQVNIYADEEIHGIVVESFWSENFGGRYLNAPTESVVNTSDVTVEKEFPSITEISWNPHDEDTVIVDNLDSGFKLLDWQNRRDFGLFGDVHWPWDPPPLPSIRAKGLESFNWSKLRANRTWRIIAEPWSNAYGKYRPTALVAHGANVEIARFSTSLPVKGRWSLSYYFPGDYAFRGRFGAHNFILHNSQIENHFQIDPKEGRGWVHVGKFEISSSPIHLDLVSVEPSKSLRVADAIRWQLLAEDEN